MIFDFLGLIAIISALSAEAILYPGFWYARTHISINAIIFLYLLYQSFSVIFFKNQNSTINSISKYLGILVLIFSSALYFFEYQYFPNYSFSNFHINPLAISLIGSILIAFSYRKSINQPPLFLLAISLVLVFSLSNTPVVLGQSISSLVSTYNNRNLTYDQKMSQKIGPDYDYFQFVNSIVKPNESIILPPWQLPWRHTGDLNYARSFLYPRSVTNGEIESINNTSNFVIISSETEGNFADQYPFWPNFPIKAKEIYIYNFDTKDYQVFTKDFDPKDWEGKSPWGLIRLN